MYSAMFIMYFSFYKYLSKFIVLLGFFSFSWNKLVRCTRLNPTINNVYEDDDNDDSLHWMVHFFLQNWHNLLQCIAPPRVHI